MAQLVNMRQRIKAIETIKKITHAMRLISMSNHARLRGKKENLEAYKNSLKHMTAVVQQAIAFKKLQEPLSKDAQKSLIILVGSQKGLCGNFNAQLFRFFELDFTLPKDQVEFISVGKYATTYLEQHDFHLIQSHSQFGIANFVHIANAIANDIFTHLTEYKNVIVYSNYPQTFFTQKPQKISLFPLSAIKEGEITPDISSYIWEENIQTLYSQLQQFYLKATLQEMLFESLLAEQAARFLSMDSSTRNAEKLQDAMQLEYNKERQASITRELIELSGSFVQSS